MSSFFTKVSATKLTSLRQECFMDRKQQIVIDAEQSPDGHKKLTHINPSEKHKRFGCCCPANEIFIDDSSKNGFEGKARCDA